MERYNGYLITDAIFVVYLISKGINKFANVSEKCRLLLYILVTISAVTFISITLFGKMRPVKLTNSEYKFDKLLDTIYLILFIINIHEFSNVWDLVAYFALVFVFLAYIGFQIYLVAKKRISFRD
ncbi:MAG: hypothetical protein NC335_02385 [Bacteroides sp.]|nr:hypothetical protein [Bacteroides sp.]